jgi:hypothetical protein
MGRPVQGYEDLCERDATIKSTDPNLSSARQRFFPEVHRA